MSDFRFILLVLVPLTLLGARRMDEGQEPSHRPVKRIADQRLVVSAAAGHGTLPLYVSQDWSAALPGVTRAVIVIHGRLRNADTYDETAQAAARAAGPAAQGSLLIVPQFLATVDARHWTLPGDTLHWGLTSWMGGEPAQGPAPISSFDALDAVLARLADRALFPHLTTVVVAGHSGGAQVVQRYAILGRGEAALGQAGIAVRYVVANPSSYAYFSADRPLPAGGFAPFDGQACPGFDTWKYGLHGLPPYAAEADPASLEGRYAARHVIYLLGGNDTDPNQPALDKSCAAEAQGPDRLARGRAYVGYLRARHRALPHELVEVPGIGHDGEAMFTSAQGLAALFDRH